MRYTKTIVIVKEHKFYFNKRREIKIPKEFVSDVHYGENFKTLCDIMVVEEVIRYGTDATKKPYTWFNTAKDTSTATKGDPTANTWDEDLMSIGYASYSFVIRGSHFYHIASAGVLSTNVTGGYTSNNSGFRPALAF